MSGALDNHQGQIHNFPPQPDFSTENLQVALRILSGTGDNNELSFIKESERALLYWENANPSLYVDSLINVIHESMFGIRLNDYPNKNKENKCLSIALISLLSIKAAVKRHWKPILAKRKVMIPFSEDLKRKLRMFLLGIVCPNNGYDNIQFSNNTTIAFPESANYQHFELWNNRTFQNNVSAVLSKIGRMDLPQNFPELIPTLFSYCETKPNTENESGQYLFHKQSILPKIYASQALNELLQELSTKRLLVDKKYFVSVAQQHVHLFIQEEAIYPIFLRSLCTRFSPPNNSIADIDANGALEYANHLTQIFRKLLTASFSSISSSILESSMKLLIEVTTHLLHTSISLHSSSTSTSSINNASHVLLESFLDIPIQLQKKYPIEFAHCMGTSVIASYLQMFYSVLQTKENVQNIPYFILISSLQFVSNVASCSDYIPSDTSDNNDQRHTFHHLIWNQFFTEQRLKEITEIILYQFIPLSPSLLSYNSSSHDVSESKLGQLDIWNKDPENYILMEFGEGATSFQDFNDSDGITNDNTYRSYQDMRAVAQNSYLALMETPGDTNNIVGQYMAGLLSDFASQFQACSMEASAIVDASNSDVHLLVKDQSILIWDAIFTAAGISVNCLTNFVDWNVWWNNSLSPALGHLIQSQRVNTFLPILRCRIIWLIGCHAHLLSPDVYIATIQTLVQHILLTTDKKNDAAVQFATIQTITSLLYEPPQGDESMPLSISPTLGISTITSLYKLLHEDILIELESRRVILNLISAVLTQVHIVSISPTNSVLTDNVNAMVVQLLQTAITPLYSIWQSCSDNQQHVLQKDLFGIISCAISTVGRLVSDSDRLISELYDVAVPMIYSALDPSLRENNIHLESDALRVWLVLMRMSKVYDEKLHNLFVRVGEVIQNDLEHLRVLSFLTEYYIILGDTLFLNAYASHVSLFLSNCLCNVRPKGAQYVNLVLEALLRKHPLDGGRLILHGGLAKRMLESCMWNYLENDKKREVDSVIVLHLTVFARMLLTDVHCLDQCLPMTDVDTMYEFRHDHLIDLFLSLFDSAGYGTSGSLRRKLWALFLISLLPPNDSLFAEHIMKELDQIVNICVDVLTEDCDRLTNDALAPHAIAYDSDEEILECSNKYYEMLVKSDFTKDIAYLTNISQFIRRRFEECAKNLGELKYQEAISSIEPAVFKQLQKLLC